MDNMFCLSSIGPDDFSLSDGKQTKSSVSKHPRAGNTSETSFDSGYFSPERKQMIKIEPLSPMLSMDLQASPLRMTSNGRESSLDDLMDKGDVSLSSEWEKDFFSNFEENLFNFDLGNNRMLDDILKSPKGKMAFTDLMKSPKGKALMESPKGKVLKDRLKYLDTPEQNKLVRSNSMGFETSPGILSPMDENQMSVTPCKPDSKSALKISRRKLTMLISEKSTQETCVESQNNPVVNAEKFQPILPNNGNTSHNWPAREKLKFARDQFTRTLAKAIESSRVKHKDSKQQDENKVCKGKRRTDKRDKYPQLKQALARPSSNVPSKTSGRNRVPSVKLRESIEAEKVIQSADIPLVPEYVEELEVDMEEEYEDVSWGYVPFTGLQQAKKRRNSEGFSVQSKRRKTSKSKR